jgi:hypothetical protein
MVQRWDLVAARRPENDLPGRWGVYSPGTGKWLDIVFGTQDEATEAIKVLQRPTRSQVRSAWVR